MIRRIFKRFRPWAFIVGLIVGQLVVQGLRIGVGYLDRLERENEAFRAAAVTCKCLSLPAEEVKP
jgi:hypothetical protein